MSTLTKTEFVPRLYYEQLCVIVSYFVAIFRTCVTLTFVNVLLEIFFLHLVTKSVEVTTTFTKIVQRKPFSRLLHVLLQALERKVWSSKFYKNSIGIRLEGHPKFKAPRYCGSKASV